MLLIEKKKNNKTNPGNKWNHIQPYYIVQTQKRTNAYPFLSDYNFGMRMHDAIGEISRSGLDGINIRELGLNAAGHHCISSFRSMVLYPTSAKIISVGSFRLPIRTN